MASSSKRAKVASEEVIDRFFANVDVWQAIFEVLSLKDRIRLEMTNKRLRTLMFECWKRVTAFDTECFTEMIYNPSMSRNRSAAFVAICVDRIGDGLRSLTILEKLIPITLWSANLRSIGETCPNVETINFLFDHGGRRLNTRFDLFSRLKTLTVSTARGNSIRAPASIFLSIPASIEVIRGLELKREENLENAAQIEGFFANRPSLREVCLGNLYTRDWSKADIFRVIAERCPDLKSINLAYSNDINYRGVVALESMKELRIPDAVLDEMEIVTICERSPLVEDLYFSLRFSSNVDQQSAVLNALGGLTKLGDLCLNTVSTDVVAPSLVTEFVRELARNSGASLRRLEILGDKMPFPTAAIVALANGCGRLRRVTFSVRVGEATPASIRLLIDSIVDNPHWVSPTGQSALQICISILSGTGHVLSADRAPFVALTAPAANLPAGVTLTIQPSPTELILDFKWQVRERILEARSHHSS